MNATMKLIPLSLSVVLLTACVQSAIRDPASPFYRVPVGSHITLNQPLEIRPGHTRVFLQRGEVTRFSDLNQYWTSCNFEVRDLKQVAQQIDPDRFTVARVQQGNTQIVGRPAMQVAGLQLLSFSNWDGGQPTVARYYDHWLSSERQPNVMRMRCFGPMADLSEAELPLYLEIEAALGTVATVEPPG